MSKLTDDPILITLSTRPGTDLASKMLFYEAEIKEIVINEITDGKVNGIAYDIGQKEFKDGRKSDIVYGIPGGKHTMATPPALVEIQQIVDMKFMKRLTRYCLNIHDLTKVEPVVMIFVIQGFSSKAFMEENFNQPQNKSYYTSKKCLWAKTCRFYSLDSISANVMSENTMKPVVALTYFLCNQKKSLFGLEKSEDPELRCIYRIAARSFEPYTTKEEENYNHIMDVMKNTNNQFQKISKCIDELKRAENDDAILKKNQAIC
ncbi:hypothetical protein BCV72DRAFT_237442 [Rhizopus microsporus var. microsporus]|uniref:Uncharacterized protein n=2 Tax=Rhizopus microsporus TaxID=58291 RepID=A0A2G4SEY4_RHIZD|nr:uncharacterized protein RHIMIDRAFT_274988 [Rhizopus microsporus ATCC 52813]ORE00723.1 hypothetical protein BCV72DRAFT_237442 [Rhizopus microsporus var. microsporus]PHZ07340.1 hypothetical protein RHIMIDRAFT_274988 [Rhizopus microsporus ATCC 52813]